MGTLDGRVAIITGAGRGIGREHALLFAAEGASVVVNDLGGASDGTGDDRTAAEQVVAEIEAAGGVAVANGDSVSSWEGAQRIVAQAVEVFGRLDVLVNNAGILRDRFLVNMTEEEWDLVVDVHMKGHFCMMRWAAEHWRTQSKAGVPVAAAVVNTASGSGLHGNPGQVQYAAAKAGIASMTMVAARELARFGVRVNAIAPFARTRLTEATPGLPEMMAAPEDEGTFDQFEPANISPLVAMLSTETCPLTGHVFAISGGQVGVYKEWSFTDRFAKDGRWTIEELQATLKDLPDTPPSQGLG